MLYRHYISLIPPPPITPQATRITGNAPFGINLSLTMPSLIDVKNGYVGIISYTQIAGGAVNVFMDVFSINPTTAVLTNVKSLEITSSSSYGPIRGFIRLNPASAGVVYVGWGVGNYNQELIFYNNYQQLNAISVSGSGSSGDWHPNGDLFAFECGTYNNINGGQILTYSLGLVSYPGNVVTQNINIPFSGGLNNGVNPIPPIMDIRWLNGDVLLVVTNYSAATGFNDMILTTYQRSGNTISLIGSTNIVLPNLFSAKINVLSSTRVIVNAATSTPSWYIFDYTYTGSGNFTQSFTQSGSYAATLILTTKTFAMHNGNIYCPFIGKYFADLTPGLSQLNTPSNFPNLAMMDFDPISGALVCAGGIPGYPYNTQVVATYLIPSNE